jgi:hypothetical protein
MSEVDIGYGTTVEVATTAAGGVFFELEEVTSFQPPQGTIDDIDTTHMKSPQRRREFKPGLTDSGAASCGLNYIPASATDIFLESWRASAEVRTVRATYADGSVVTFTAYVSTYSPDNQTVDGKKGATLNMKVTGAVTVSGAAAPVNQLLPAISGIADGGVALTAFPGQWTGGPTFTYQWQEDTAGNGTWVNIAGATSRQFTPGAGQVGDRLRVGVTAINAAGTTGPVYSAPTILTVA